MSVLTIRRCKTKMRAKVIKEGRGKSQGWKYSIRYSVGIPEGDRPGLMLSQNVGHY